MKGIEELHGDEPMPSVGGTLRFGSATSIKTRRRFWIGQLCKKLRTYIQRLSAKSTMTNVIYHRVAHIIELPIRAKPPTIPPTTPNATTN
jgi:ATP phosphoribosyltransferase